MLEDLLTIYNLNPPFVVKVTPIGIDAIVEVDVHGHMSSEIKLPSQIEDISTRTVQAPNLIHHNLSLKEANSEVRGSITILADLFASLNAANYESQLLTFENPKQAILNQLFKDNGDALIFWQQEEVRCSDLTTVVKFLTELVKSGLLLEFIDINGVVLDVGKSSIAVGMATHTSPMVSSTGLIKGMLHLDKGCYGAKQSYVINNAFDTSRYNGRPVLIIDDLILADKKPQPVIFDICPVCHGEVEHKYSGDYCINSDCQPFVESFLSSISRQTDIPIDILRNQYAQGEVFHYPQDSSVEMQSRGEVPVDIFRTHLDILGLASFHLVLGHFYKLNGSQNHPYAKCAAIDGLFIKHISAIRSTDQELYTQPVVYYHPYNQHMSVMIIGSFDGISEQTLKLQLSAKGFKITSIAQEATFVIAGNIEDDEFYSYITEVSNVFILKTGGGIYRVFDLMKLI